MIFNTQKSWLLFYTADKGKGQNSHEFTVIHKL